MTPPAGSTPAERWVSAGRLAAARDLTRQLLASDRVGSVFVLGAEAADREVLRKDGAIPWSAPQEPFHFGHALAAFVTEKEADRLAYFGGASAPLFEPGLLEQAVQDVDADEGPHVWVNNYYSTDWAILNHAVGLCSVADRLDTDNPLGWVLSHDAGYRVDSFPASAATRADIDTSSDLLMLSGHPRLGPSMRAFLAQAPGELLRKIDRLRDVMETPASTLTLIGRSSSHLWQSLERRTQIWVRLMVEERGMLASGRLARGEVQSLVGAILDEWGPERFVRELAAMSDAVLWDTRVWMASHGQWPSDRDRFAADLGWADQVEDSRLRALSEAIREAPIPILTGGHGIVAGSIYALVETLKSQPPGESSP